MSNAIITPNDYHQRALGEQPEQYPPRKKAPKGFFHVDERYRDYWIKKNSAPIDALSTGLPTLDAMCMGEGGGKGIAAGWYTILAGRSNVGKTIFGLHFLRAFLQHEAASLESLEMGHRSVAQRLLSQVSGTRMSSLSPGDWFDVNAAKRAWDALLKLRGDLYMNAKAIRSLSAFEQAVTELTELGVRNHVVDYLQLLPVPDERGTFEKVTAISQTMQNLTYDHGLRTLALAQFTKSGATTDEEPDMYGLSGSGSLINDPDLILIIDHTKLRKEGGIGYTQLIVAKNRHGPTGSIPVKIDYRTMQVSENQSGVPFEEAWNGHPEAK